MLEIDSNNKFIIIMFLNDKFRRTGAMLAFARAITLKVLPWTTFASISSSPGVSVSAMRLRMDTGVASSGSSSEEKDTSCSFKCMCCHSGVHESEGRLRFGCPQCIGRTPGNEDLRTAALTTSRGQQYLSEEQFFRLLDGSDETGMNVCLGCVRGLTSA